MTDYPSIERLSELQQMIADFAKVTRDNIPFADNKRSENDVEHSFGLALTCWYLQPKIAPELDLLRILQYALAHDLVELHAGDTYVFDEKAVASKPKREQHAIHQLAIDWPDFQELTTHTNIYAQKENEEAKFVKAVDKIIPLMMIELANEIDYWKKRNITMDKLMENKKTIFVSEQVSPYYNMIFDWLNQRGNIPNS